MKPSQLLAALPKLIEAGHPTFIWGDPGIGKSDIVREVAASLKIGLIDLRLTLYDPTDLKGYPVRTGTGAKETMSFIPPALLPTKGKGILFLDELPQAAPATQAASYQLVLDRKLNEYKLPDGWQVIAAGNHARNGGVHHAMPPALANRFTHITLTPDHAEWDDWARGKVDDLVRAYLRFRPAQLLDMEARKAGIAYPTPRSWAKCGQILAQGHGVSAELELLTGTIGEGAATELLAFIKTARELPSLEEILLSPDTAPVPVSPGAKYAVATLLESKASKTNIKQCLTYMGRLDKEYQTAFMHNITRTKRELSSTKEYIDWCLANRELLGVG